MSLFVIVGLALAIYLLLMPIPFQGRASRALGDLVHAPLFGSMAIAAMMVMERLRPLRDDFSALTIRGMTVILILSAAGAAMEVLQQTFGRSASTHDAMSNALGITAAVLCYIGWRWNRFRIRRKHVSRACFASAGCLLALAWYSPSLVLRDVVNVDRQFPLLASFESPAEMGRFWFTHCRADRTRADATHGSYALEVEFEARSFPTLTLIELQHDWSQAEAMEIDVTLDAAHNEPVTFAIQVLDGPRKDAEEDTYRGSWTLDPGVSKRIRISREELIEGPEGRELDLAKIANVDLSVVEPEVGTRIRIDRMWLQLR